MAGEQSIIAGPVVDFVEAYAGELFGSRAAAADANAASVTDVTYHNSAYRAPGAEDVPTVYAAVSQSAPELQHTGRPGDKLQQAAWVVLAEAGVTS